MYTIIICNDIISIASMQVYICIIIIMSLLYILENSINIIYNIHNRSYNNVII